MQNFKEQFKKIASDLLNLEINTIVKSNIEGLKMPGPRHALLDIARDFDSALLRLGAKRFDEKRDGEKHDDTGGFAAFDQLRRRANQKTTEIEKEGGEMTEKRKSDILMLQRIKDKSDQIKGMFNSIRLRKVDNWDNAYSREQIETERPSFPLNADELVLIRKIWEIGTEEIAMQTVIQLDGDVVTRVQPKYVSSGSELIHNFHNQGISTSVGFWKDLVGIAGVFFESIIKIFFKK